MTTPIPADKVLIHATNDPIDIGRDYHVEYPIIGDARLELRQMIDACDDLLDGGSHRVDGSVAEEVAGLKREWLDEWEPTLTSAQVPITPYRVLREFMKIADPANTIVTPDSGSTRRQFVAFYESMGPRTHIGWGKSHGLGAGLGLIIGAKLAAPDKFAVNFMGDGAFGMTGLDFETAVRSRIPVLTVVYNNSMLAGEDTGNPTSHRLYGTAAMSGNYADMAAAMGGWSERVEDPAEIAPALSRAKAATEEGKAALLEFITAKEPRASHPNALS
jgi:thiamine pyrophosphate-dependent acetolactate synthase large subunit-like protein